MSSSTVMRGVGDAAAAAGALVVGGDLSSGPLWSADDHGAWPCEPIPSARAAARPGDGVWVTGRSAPHVRRSSAWRRGGEPSPEARRAFAHPTPRIDAGGGSPHTVRAR